MCGSRVDPACAETRSPAAAEELARLGAAHVPGILTVRWMQDRWNGSAGQGWAAEQRRVRRQRQGGGGRAAAPGRRSGVLNNVRCIPTSVCCARWCRTAAGGVGRAAARAILCSGARLRA